MELTTLFFIAGALATWRIAHMVTDEEGPFSIFRSLRAKFHQGTWIGRGLNCVYCISFWVGIGAALVWMPSFEGLVIGLAWSSMAILFDTILAFVLKRS